MKCTHPHIVPLFTDHLTGKKKICFKKPDYLAYVTRADEQDRKDVEYIDLRDGSRHTMPLLSIPCGHCLACRINHAREWAVRCSHESQLHEMNSFLTLTYDDVHLPLTHSGVPTLVRRDITLFLKRLRKALDVPIRYYVCGDYGASTQRPHYHMLVFGYDFYKDREILKTTIEGYKYYTSPLLTRTWPFGYHVLTDLTPETCAYTTRYVTGKIKEETEDSFPDREKIYSVMSRRPGLAHDWFVQYGLTDVFVNDLVVLDRKIKGKPPRYYDYLLGLENPDLLKEIKAKRLESAVDQEFEDPVRAEQRNRVYVHRENMRKERMQL